MAKLYKRSSGSGGSSSFLCATVLENMAVALIGVFLYSFLQSSDEFSIMPSSSGGDYDYDDADGESSFLAKSTSSSSSCDDPLSSTYFRLALVCGAIDAVSSIHLFCFHSYS